MKITSKSVLRKKYFNPRYMTRITRLLRSLPKKLNMSQKFWGTRAYRQCSIQNTIYLLSIAILFLSRAQWVENELKMAFIFHIAKKCPHLQKPKCICNEFDIWIVFFRFINFFQDINILYICKSRMIFFKLGTK